MDNNESKFMFVHQADWQQRLLLRYGSELVLMDATFENDEVLHSPFLHMCPHLCGIQRGGRISLPNQRQEGIAEALIILKRWNPKYFMDYYSTAEINAI